MSNKYFILLTSILVSAAGCATDTQVTLLRQAGPDPALTAQNSGAGFLQVYSARERIPIDVNAEEFFWNNDFDRNDFLFYPAHTSYALYAQDGHPLESVRNARGMYDGNPTLVKLSPGVYKVEAKARDSDAVNWTVMIPVVIEPGLTTAIHLDGYWDWAMARKKSDEIVGLPNGDIVGWHFPKPEGSISASN